MLAPSTQPQDQKTVKRDGITARLVQTKEQLAEMIWELYQARTIAWDTETTGLDVWAEDFKIVGVCVATSPHKAWYVPVGHMEPEQVSFFDIEIEQLDPAYVLRSLKALLEAPYINHIYHNFKYDLKVWWRAYEMHLQEEINPICTADTMLLIRAADDTLKSLGLKNRSRVDLGRSPDEIPSKNFAHATLLDALEYAAADAANTFALYEHWIYRAASQGRSIDVWRDIEMPCIEPVAYAEYCGVTIDTDYLDELTVKLNQELDNLQDELDAVVKCLPAEAAEELASLGKITLSNDSHVRKLVFGILLGRDEWAEEPADDKALVEAKIQLEDTDSHDGRTIVGIVQRHRTLSKLRSTYTEALNKHVSKVTNKIHTEMLQHGAKSGRFSCKSPNLQNLPRRDDSWNIRSALTLADPDNYCIVVDDLTSAEMVIAAIQSKCPYLLPIVTEQWLYDPKTQQVCKYETLEEATRAKEWLVSHKDPNERRELQKIDIHKWTAASAFDVEYSEVTKSQRQAAKPVNFGILYGITAIGLMIQLDCSLEEAQRMIDGWYKAYPGVEKWLEGQKAFAKENGFTETYFGRRRRLSREEWEELKTTPSNVRGVIRTLLNHPIQGTVGDLLKIAMARVYRRLKSAGLDAIIVMQIHDELIVEAHKSCAMQVKDILEEEMSFVLRNGDASVLMKCDAEFKNTWSKQDQVVTGVNDG